jgi:hypothetical protein
VNRTIITSSIWQSDKVTETVFAPPANVLYPVQSTRIAVEVNSAVSVLLLASVAVTVLSVKVAEGTVNEQLKSPTLMVWHELGDVSCATSLNSIVTVLVPPNPVPVTVTVCPTGPLVGLMVIAAVTAKFTLLVLVPSVAATAWLPLVEWGTVNEQLKLLELGLGWVQGLGDVVWATPPYVIVMS